MRLRPPISVFTGWTTDWLRILLCSILFWDVVRSSCEHLHHSPYAQVELLTRRMDETLEICPRSEKTCCTRAMELRIQHNDGRSFRNAVEDRVIVLRHLLHSNLERMRNHFISSLASCHTHLDTMFNRTYGRYYQQNREVFAKFFRQLESFASAHSVVPVELMVDNLFAELYLTLYQLLNPLKKLNQDTKRCMKETMGEMRPFGEVPERVRDGLRRGLEGWRALVSDLDEAHSILGVFLNTSLTDQCTAGLARMGDCSMCAQSEPTKPCLNFCLNIARGCLAEWAEVDQQWDALTGGLARLISSLNGPHSLQAAFHPLPVQISEAIMTFQDKGATITNKVLATCFSLEEVFTGENRADEFYRKKRAVWLRHVIEQADGSWNVLAQIMNTFKDKLLSTRNFFGNLPDDLCGEPQFSTGGNDKCWTGKHIGSYHHQVVGEKTTAQRSNPEFQGKRAFQYRGLFIDERLRLGMLAAKVKTSAAQISGKSVENEEAEERRRLVDEESDEGELEEASGDLPTGNSGSKASEKRRDDQAREENLATNALEHTASSSENRNFGFSTIIGLISITFYLICP